MIVGVSHLTLACSGIQKAISKFEIAGFTTDFVEENIPNAQVKQPFLNAYSDFHSLALLRLSKGIPIELVDSGSLTTNSNCPRYTPILTKQISSTGSKPDKNTHVEKLLSLALEIPALHLYDWPHFESTFFYGASGKGNQPLMIQALALEVQNLDKSQRFWERALPFRSNTGNVAGTEWRTLVGRMPLEDWSVGIILIENRSDDITLSFLDTRGFNCLAFITTDIHKDRNLLLENGASQATGVFSIEVNSKKLLVDIFRGPSNELIELVEIKNVRALGT